MRSLPSASKLLVVLISLQFFMPAVLSSVPVSATGVTTSVQKNDIPSKDWELTIGKQVSPAPSALKSYAETIVKQLSQQKTFHSWIHSELQYFPLGPGTHSWLATISKDQKELGYLIFTAKSTNAQEYVLSEYGASPAAPYDLTALHQTLAELDIISPSSTDNDVYPTNIEPLYSPLLPLWKVSFGHQETLYLNALTMDIQPWDESHSIDINQDKIFSGVVFSTTESSYATTPVISRKGQNDPLDNLMWITTTPLSIDSDLDFESYIHKHNSLIFTSPNRNEYVGGPFAISGFQKWTTKHGSTLQTIYAGTGPSGHRYVPLSTLRNKGQFHSFPISNGVI